MIKSRRIRWAGRVACMGEVNNIRTDLREIWREGVEWMHLVQDNVQWRALVNTVMYLQVP
jgi:hypothetical protein